MLKRLLFENEYRGRDATGIAFQRGSEIMLVKEPMPAKQFIHAVKPSTWDDIAASPIVLLHTRARTKGTEKNKENNHPVSGLGWTVVHNGVISNDDWLWEYSKKDRFAEVDTSAIPLVLSQGKNYLDSLKHLGLLAGSVSTAAWCHDDPTRLALARIGGSDVYVGIDQGRSLLMWSSDIDGLKALGGYAVGALPFRTYTKLPDNSITVLQLGAPAVTYKINTNPFRRPFVASSTSTDSGRRPPAREWSAGSFYTVTAYKWFDTNSTVFKDKPRPNWNKNKIEWGVSDLTRVHGEFHSNNKLVSTGFQTPYGQWIVNRTKDGLARIFQPTKNHRKWFERVFGEKLDLPISLGTAERNFAGTTKFDERLNLEVLHLHVIGRSNHEWDTEGYNCPLCGAWAQHWQWARDGDRCIWCHVRSKRPVPPPKETTAA